MISSTPQSAWLSRFAWLTAAATLGLICLGGLVTSHEAGLAVPEQFSVVGYDDSAFMNCMDPPLTTVRQPLEAIGKAAVAMLAGQIDGIPVTAEELFFEPELVVRGSTAPVSVPAATG